MSARKVKLFPYSTKIAEIQGKIQSHSHRSQLIGAARNGTTLMRLAQYDVGAQGG
jgi:filamentous hemagglutinin family protein